MASNVPIARQMAWFSLVPHMVLMGLLIYFYSLLQFAEPVICGALTYLALSFVLRTFVAKSHRLGMKLVKQQKFQEAIAHFENSISFFTRNSWVDKYRYLVLLSSSSLTYKEMGLCNIAFCYGQINEGEKAREYYSRTLNEFPENGLALAGLRMINSISNSAAGQTK